jgi:hypothetical protein
MIDGLTLDYAGSRALARLAWRPDQRLWQRLHAASSLHALLERARSAAVGNYLSGVGRLANCDDVDAAFRTQWRARVAELAGWSPTSWREAVRWSAHLADVSGAAHLWIAAPPCWMRTDAVFARYADGNTATRRAALSTGPLAPLGLALTSFTSGDASAADGADAHPAARKVAAEVLPRALAAWLAHWRALWPAVSATEQADLDGLVALTRAHRQRFAALPVADTGAAREAFAEHVTARLRADPSRPLALFAYLLLVALDLERLRAECLLRVVDEDVASSPDEVP